MSLSSEVGLGELTARIACLAVGEVLTVAEFHAEEARRWRILVDAQGTPRVKYVSRPWVKLRRGGMPDEGELIRFLAPSDERHLLIAGGRPEAESADSDYARRLAIQRYDGASVLAPDTASVDEQVGEATARVPLSQWYELYLLDRGRSGQFVARPRELFERGARRGATRTLRVYCEPSGPAGTTFAVVARRGPNYSGVVCMASGRVSPGPHTVTATLQRPGRVRFDGLGVQLHEESRKWDDVRATVPGRLSEFGPARLIVAVETCGHEFRVAAHVDRAAQLVDNVAIDAEYPVSFSLLAYGAHPHDVRVDDDPVTVLAWEAPPEAVLAQLSVLRRQAGGRQDHYADAANVECMLRQVAGLLRMGRVSGGQPAAGGRPVLVTVGSRPPFPAWRDPATEILPCPAHHDWRWFIGALKEAHREMAFGAICGGDRDAEAWRLLGTDASAELIVLDSRQFAAELRLLRPPGEHVPFPLVLGEVS